QDEWAELETLLDRVLGRNGAKASADTPVAGTRLAALYRRACEQLALARARAYPAYLVERLERLTADAHQLIYHRRELGLARLKHVIATEFPAAVRRRIVYVAVAAAVFVLPTLVVGLLVYRQPEMILTVVDSETAASY